MAEPRIYAVGLPVIITVHDNGTVEWSIDKSDTAKEISENYPSPYVDPPVTEAQVEDDIERIENAINAEATA